jgi:hypothetical protein
VLLAAFDDAARENVTVLPAPAVML